MIRSLHELVVYDGDEANCIGNNGGKLDALSKLGKRQFWVVFKVESMAQRIHKVHKVHLLCNAIVFVVLGTNSERQF
jgi:hypothetical protein